MPSVRKKRAQNKQNYFRNKGTRTSKGHLPRLVRTLIRKGQLPRLVIGRTLSPKGDLPGRPPILVIGRTLSPKGHLPDWNLSDGLSIDQLPVHTPMTLFNAHPMDYTSNTITVWQRTYCVSK